MGFRNAAQKNNLRAIEPRFRVGSDNDFMSREMGFCVGKHCVEVYLPTARRAYGTIAAGLIDQQNEPGFGKRHAQVKG